MGALPGGISGATVVSHVQNDFYPGVRIEEEVLWSKKKEPNLSDNQKYELILFPFPEISHVFCYVV